MAAKALTGAGVLYTDRRQFYLSPDVTKELWTDVTPFTTLTMSRNVITGLADPIFKMFEHRDPWIKQEFQVNDATPRAIPNNDTGYANLAVDGVVGLPAVDSSWVGLECEVWDETKTTRKGVVLITATGSGVITIKLLGTTAFNTADNDYFVVVSSASGEGTTAPQANSDELKLVWGSTQIRRTPIEITGTLYQASLRGYNKELERLRMLKSKEHKMHGERQRLFGGSVLGTGLADSRDGTSNESFADSARTDANGNTVRTSMGIVTAIEKYGLSSGDDQNIFTVAEGAYTYANFVDDMEKVFHYYPDGGVKYAFCGPGAMSYWSKLDGNQFLSGNSGWQVKVGEQRRDSLGFSIRQMETPHGILNLVPTPALRGPYNKYMVVVSDANLSLVQYRPDAFNANIKTDDGYDGEKDEYFSDDGLGMTLIESHKLFKIV